MKQELKALLALSLPVVGGQIGMMLLHAVDTLMLGRFGVTELAAAALGTQWIFFTLTVGMGVVSGIDPIVAERHGASDGTGTARALQQGVLIATLLSLVISISWFFTEDILLFSGQEPALCRLAARYTLIQLPSILPFLAWAALRSYLQGRGIVRPAMWVMLPVNLLNLALNWVLIFGHLGAPELGLTGAAIATAVSRTLTGGLLLAWVLAKKLHEGAWERPKKTTFSLASLRKPLFLGLPIGLQMGFEVGAFALTALVAGRLGRSPLAAHSIVLSVAALLFMTPLGLSLGATTRVGNLIGAGRAALLPTTLKALGVLGLGAMAVNAGALLVLGRDLAEFSTKDPEVVALAVSAFAVCAAFQLSDSVQVISGGALRGMGHTRPPAVATFVGYYAFGIPFGYWLGVRLELGLAGLWWGLALGLTVVGLALSYWLVKMTQELIASQARQAPASMG